jgi:predicted HNH restriction endonuclease
LKRRTNKKRYPPDWEEIALAVKQASGWRCQHCNRLCTQRGYKNSTLTRSDWGKIALCVHHANFTPEDNRPENLIALCIPCHLAIHAQGHSNVSPGQLSLL